MRLDASRKHIYSTSRITKQRWAKVGTPGGGERVYKQITIEGYMKRRRVASAERGVHALTADIEDLFFHSVFSVARCCMRRTSIPFILAFVHGLNYSAKMSFLIIVASCGFKSWIPNWIFEAVIACACRQRNGYSRQPSYLGRLG